MPQPIPARARPYEDRQLVHDAASGDRAARERLVIVFWSRIAGIARTYQGVAAVERAELMQEGVAGLLTALERYDPALGTPFWGYACWWVRHAMQCLVARLIGPTVLSDRAARSLARLKHARRTYEQTCGREPSTAELAGLTGMAREHVERLLSSQRGSRSLDEPRAGEDPADTALRDRLADPAGEDAYDRVLERLQIDDVRRMLERLGVRERRVLRGRYGIGQPSHTLRELAEELCVSAERVRQIEEEGLERLRRELARRGTWDRHEHEDTEDAP